MENELDPLCDSFYVLSFVHVLQLSDYSILDDSYQITLITMS